MDDKTRATLQRGRRQSLRAIPVYLVMIAIAAVVVFLKPRWWSWIILGVTAFTLVGDVLNGWHASRALALDGDRDRKALRRE